MVDGVLFLILSASGGRLLRPSRPWPEEKQISVLYSGEAAATGEESKSGTSTSARRASPEKKLECSPGASSENFHQSRCYASVDCIRTADLRQK